MWSWTLYQTIRFRRPLTITAYPDPQWLCSKNYPVWFPCSGTSMPVCDIKHQQHSQLVMVTMDRTRVVMVRELVKGNVFQRWTMERGRAEETESLGGKLGRPQKWVRK